MASIPLKFATANGIRLRYADVGSGPAVLLLHGWPELWYSWRHQIRALSAAGYRVICPDLRGFGGSDSPPAEIQYDQLSVARDILGLLKSLEVEKAAIVGHDWGALITYFLALYSPQTFPAVCGMSVPYVLPNPKEGPMAGFYARAGDNFQYILYHNEGMGIAEREYDARPREFLTRLYCAGSVRCKDPLIKDKRRSAGGWIDRFGDPVALPEWLLQEDIDYFVTEYQKSGFRGGVNYYRNMHRNWQQNTSMRNTVIQQPFYLVVGSKDMVLSMYGGIENVRQHMKKSIARPWDPQGLGTGGISVLANAGHWIQQECAEEVNEKLLAFLKDVFAAPGSRSHL